MSKYRFTIVTDFEYISLYFNFSDIIRYGSVLNPCWQIQYFFQSWLNELCECVNFINKAGDVCKYPGSGNNNPFFYFVTFTVFWKFIKMFKNLHPFLLHFIVIFRTFAFSLFINDIITIFHNLDFLFYADDLKLFKETINQNKAL